MTKSEIDETYSKLYEAMKALGANKEDLAFMTIKYLKAYLSINICSECGRKNEQA